MQCMAVIGVTCTIIQVIMMIIISLIPSGPNSEQAKMVMSLTMFIQITACFLCILTQTAYVMHKNKQWLVEGVVQSIESELDDGINNQTILTSTNKAIQNAMSSIPSVDRASTSEANSIAERSRNSTNYSIREEPRGGLEDVLRDENGFDSFFFHLNREFSTEVLLSLLEMTQFKERVLEEATKRRIAGTGWKEQICELLDYPTRSSEIPKSQIVYGDPVDERYKSYLNGVQDAHDRVKVELFARAHCLYLKYVKKESKFEVNISWPVRHKLVKEMDVMKSWICDTPNSFTSEKEAYTFLFELFDDCMNQNQGLLRNSFLRYQTGMLYREWIRTFKPS